MKIPVLECGQMLFLFMWTSYFSSFSSPLVTRPHDNHNNRDGEAGDNPSLRMDSTLQFAKPRLQKCIVPGSKSSV